jgi:malonyl-CoA/methylmalonyl-CoA synthetase
MSLPLFERARCHADRIAVRGPDGSATYEALLQLSERAATSLHRRADWQAGERTAVLVEPGLFHVAVQWGIWRAGGVAVPLCLQHPTAELAYVVQDSGARAVVAGRAHDATARLVAQACGVEVLGVEELINGGDRELPDCCPDGPALMLYTSGTTSRPKGVVTTHANIEAQVRSLTEAWEWSCDDRILHFLPLHHIHGVINVLTCALWSGACCDMLPKFEAAAVWNRLIEGDFTLFMAVPTIYTRLIGCWDAADTPQREEMSEACARLRLMVSGSAALPVSTLARWKEITGHTLLERYGMTEIGMALSNPLNGERRPGSVGLPLPGVEVRLGDEEGAPIAEGTPGEILVRGPGVFAEYWGRTEATREAFRDGWFRTGDVAVLEAGYYRILGRSSVDIIKTGGYKVSALEVEEVLREHPAIEECAIVGVPDAEWGERVSAVVVFRGAEERSLTELRDWARERLAPYKLPSLLRVVTELPRNAMGKVVKPELVPLFA